MSMLPSGISFISSRQSPCFKSTGQVSSLVSDRIKKDRQHLSGTVKIIVLNSGIRKFKKFPEYPAQEKSSRKVAGAFIYYYSITISQLFL
jgi:hypothetical protein